MASVERTVPAPRKDLNKKRRRATPQKPPVEDPVALDMESLLATLTDDATPLPDYYTYEEPPQTKVNYCTYNVQPRPKIPEPRLLLRQAYKLATEAYAVVGLESKGDFEPSIYLVNDTSNVKITFEDFMSLTGVCVVSSVNRLFDESVPFQPVHLDKITVEVSATRGLHIYNYDIRSYKQFTVSGETEPPRFPSGLHLQKDGWTALTRMFDCIENYYKLCAELSMLVPHLIDRYSRYFVRRYKPQALLLTTNTSSMYPVPSLNPDMKQFVTTELPTNIKALSEYRLPVELQTHWYQTSPLREALTPWVDAEVRRYCIPNIIDSVLDGLKYAARWF